MHPDDDNYTAEDQQYTGPNRRRASDEDLHNKVSKIANDIQWFTKVVYACWIVLGIVMYYGVLPAANAVHKDIDDNTTRVTLIESRIAILEASKTKGIERSREDHRTCHMKDLP